MIETCISDETKKVFGGVACEHPLDKDVLNSLTELNTLIKGHNEYAIYRHSTETDALWRLLLEKAIKCLRYHDDREPFMENNAKRPQVYGVSELVEYYNKYIEFESMLYGSSQYYRDHVVHVLRTWLLGTTCLVRNNGKYLGFVSIQGEDDIILEYDEKLSIWTIIALTHDLGYPLEKAKGIIDKTHSMIATFVTNPGVSMDLSFHGAQNYMNDFIVRLMSSKMVHDSKRADTDKPYVARLQPKYYFKFQKSLEKTKHGIISTLIIYKLLTYFLESDYSINEDYGFSEKDRKQFYIRREILRAIASHTCTDVYHLFMGSFAFFLIIADDMQEWGRKYISELYVPATIDHTKSEVFFDIFEKKADDKEIKPHQCTLSEEVEVKESDGWQAVAALLKRLRDQSLTYITIFRDGQETRDRDFLFTRKYTITYGESSKVEFSMELAITKDAPSSLTGNIVYSPDQARNSEFGEKFIKELFEQTRAKIDWETLDSNGNKNTDPGQWRNGTICISLTN